MSAVPTAKSRFIGTPHAAKWLDVVETDVFSAATEAAMLTYASSLTETAEPVSAAACYQRLLGARGFLAALCTVADKYKEPPAKPTSANLDHTVR